MERTRKRSIAKAAVVLGAIPILLWAYEYGPNPGYVGIPSENGGQTCANAGCHTGTANSPSNHGSVTVNFPNGMTYTPGVAQQLSVTIQDPATTQQAYGFELTARLASNASNMAGSFAYLDSNTQLMCSQTNLQVFEAVCNAAAVSKGCPAASSTPTCPSGMTLQYIEHSYAGYVNSLQPPHNGSYTYNFNWTPPTTDVGNVTIYVAGNAGVGGAPTCDGDHIYTNKYTLTPSAGGPLPAINSAGVVNGASFQPGVVPNSWITIQGTDFTSTTDTWANAISGGKLPTVLDGVGVKVGGQDAYVYYISPTQINVLAPNVGTGSMSVTVSNANGISTAATATSTTVAPAFFLWPEQSAGGHAQCGFERHLDRLGGEERHLRGRHQYTGQARRSHHFVGHRFRTHQSGRAHRRADSQRHHLLHSRSGNRDHQRRSGLGVCHRALSRVRRPVPGGGDGSLHPGEWRLPAHRHDRWSAIAAR